MNYQIEVKEKSDTEYRVLIHRGRVGYIADAMAEVRLDIDGKHLAKLMWKGDTLNINLALGSRAKVVSELLCVLIQSEEDYEIVHARGMTA